MPSLAALSCIRWTDENGRRQTFRLVDKASAKWQLFGTLLGVSSNNLTAWEVEHQRNAVSCWNKVMNFWLTGGGSSEYPISWEGLFILLADADLSEVAKDMEIAVCASE